jgi:hypothetical protein
MIKKSSTRILNEALSSMFNKELVLCHIVGDKIIEWFEPELEKPTEEEIQAKIAELEAAEPMRLLKEERNRLLAETDWRFRVDQDPSQEWYDYCQALRDLPANSDPQLDENVQLINVTWPTPPEN